MQSREHIERKRYMQQLCDLKDQNIIKVLSLYIKLNVDVYITVSNA